MFIYFKVFTLSTNDHCNPCQFLCSCYLSWSVFAKKGHVYTLIVCDSDEDKYTFSSIILSDFWLVYCFYFFFKKVFEFFLKYKYVLEKTLNLNIHAMLTDSKIWNIYSTRKTFYRILRSVFCKPKLTLDFFQFISIK